MTVNGWIGVWIGDECKTVVAHRIAWELTHGPIPEGLKVLHRCDNPPCVNPSHLFLGTVKDNHQDAMAKGRDARGERHGRSKLNLSKVAEIRSRRAHGETLRSIARDFDVNTTTIASVVNHINWK